jgi:hypothetical protein
MGGIFLIIFSNLRQYSHFSGTFVEQIAEDTFI